MLESDKNRILNCLIGNESINEFESWIYKTINLENRIGHEFYCELIDLNYKEKFSLVKLHKIVVGNFISNDDFEDFKYKNTLVTAGWYPGRKIKVELTELPNTLEIQNAFKIIEEFGGLKFTSPDKQKNESLTLIEFLKAPFFNSNMRNYGVNKNLVCFATAHNSHIDLFIDEDFNLYHLDNIVSEVLYKFKGDNFKHFMLQILLPNYENKFEIAGKLNRKT